MRYKRSETPLEQFERLSEWHQWFAWFPVDVGFDRHWLETLERRMQYHKHIDETGHMWGLHGWWEYRALEEKAKV